MASPTARRYIAWILVGALVWDGPLFANQMVSGSVAGGFEPDFILTALQEYDPAIKEFAQSSWNLPKFADIDSRDPVLDQDPFFLRSQKYLTPFAHPEGESTAFQVKRGGLEIHVRGTRQSLFIEQPFAPVFEFENYLFLRATDPEYFAAKSADAASYGEGLFFIDKRYIYTEARKRIDPRPVPVFFLPLNGRGWTSKIRFGMVGDLATLALQNEAGERTTLDIVQINDLAKLLHNNVVMATVLAAKRDVDGTQRMRRQWLAQNGDVVELPMSYPARGSTAAFGFFFTGLDLDAGGGRSAAMFDWLPKAEATNLLSPDVLERLITVAQITGTTFLAGWLAQHTILSERMKERRAFIQNKEDEIAFKRGRVPPRREGVVYNVKTEVKETIDVFSHGLAALASGAGASLGFVLEYGADRFLGHTGRNGMVRKFLEKTFLYSRRQNELIGANWNTFFLGVVVLGGIDTASVVLQLLYVSPVFFPYTAGLISDELRNRMIHNFSGADPSTKNILTSEIMRNLTGYFVHGAYSYSSSQRQALLEIVRPEVERQMANEHKDIEDPEFKKEYDRRIEARLELMLVERGLPTNAEFLFSGPSLVRSLAQLMGFKVDRAKLYSHPDYRQRDDHAMSVDDRIAFNNKKDWQKRLAARMDRLIAEAAIYPENAAEVERFRNSAESLKASLITRIERAYDNESFVLEKARWGLLTHALKRAELVAAEMSERHPENASLRSARDILHETRSKYRFLIQAIFRPWRVAVSAHDAFQVRKMMTYLSYEGQVIGTGVKYLDLWDAANENPEAALIAARLFRQSLFALIQDKPEFLRPSESDLVKYLPEARTKAREVLHSTSSAMGFDDSDVEILALEIVKEEVQKAASQKRASNWRPPSADPLELAQRGHAHREALIEVVEKTGMSVEPDPMVESALYSGDPEQIVQLGGDQSAVSQDAEQMLVQNPQAIEIYREAYRKSLGDQLGLKTFPPEESELVRRVIDLADKEVGINVEKNPGWKEYLGSLDEVGQLRFLTHQYADTFLSKYIELTVSNSSAVDLTSPEQPGFFQKLRNMSVPKSDSWIGRTTRTILRVLESPMDSTAYRPGFSQWLRRSVPWYQDAKTDIQLTLRVMWTSLSVGYLVQFYLWQVKFTWPTALFFLFTGGITTIVHYWTDRLMMNVGVRPMSDTWSKVKYSLLYTWLTFPSYLPFIFWNEDFNRFWTRWVSTPIASTCEKLLSLVF